MVANPSSIGNDIKHSCGRKFILSILSNHVLFLYTAVGLTINSRYLTDLPHCPAEQAIGPPGDGKAKLSLLLLQRYSSLDPLVVTGHQFFQWSRFYTDQMICKDLQWGWSIRAHNLFKSTVVPQLRSFVNQKRSQESVQRLKITGFSTDFSVELNNPFDRYYGEIIIV